jgi:hypothetical protein
MPSSTNIRSILVSTIHFVDSEKGGTGKSWFSRVMHHTFQTRNRSFLGVDADTSNPTYHNVYTDTQRIPFSVDPKEQDLPDILFDMALADDLIVSLPAQAHRPVHQWLTQKNVLLLAKEHGIVVKKWWISDGEDDSLNLFVESVKAYGADIQHVFVKNRGRCTEWDYFDRHQSVQAIISEQQVPVIEFPALSDFRRIQINATRMTFAQALTHDAFGLLGRSQVAAYLRDAAQALEQGGAFPQTEPSQTKPPATKKKKEQEAQSA